MKKQLAFLFAAIFVLTGCSRTWQFTSIDTFKPTEPAPQTAICQPCHQAEFDSWKKTRHSSETRMSVIPIQDLRACGACHTGLAAHAVDPTVKPGPLPDKMSKTEQNTLCGKCHFNQKLLNSMAINPEDKHALLTNVGFEGKEKQITCLDCHSGHKGGADMLVSIKAHICFKCHKEAIVTMGIFQPFNYIAFGKFCQACHAVHGGSSGAQWTRMGIGVCVVCHFAGVALVGD
jgi:predicted CXXCH cytochrome family protein